MEEVDSYGFRISTWSHSVYQWRWYTSNSMEGCAWWTYRKTLYLLQNISLKNYYGSKWTTTKSTIVSDEEGVPYTLPQDAINNYIELYKKLKSHKVILPGRCCSNPWCFYWLYEQNLWQTSCSHPRWGNHNMFTTLNYNECE